MDSGHRNQQKNHYYPKLVCFCGVFVVVDFYVFLCLQVRDVEVKIADAQETHMELDSTNTQWKIKIMKMVHGL